MKSMVLVFLALACVIGLSTCQYPSPYYGYSGTQGSSGFGNGGLLMLFGALFLFLILFSSTSSSSGSTVSFVNISG